MSTVIYYFSGTGNSLHVARELQRRIPTSNLIPIVSLLPSEIIRTSADTTVLVFPNFCLTIPIPVHDFLEKADFASAKYISAICTRGGTPSEAFDYINVLLRRQGKKLDAQINITMPWNHPVGKENLPDTTTDERIQHLESEMQNKLDVFSTYIHANEAYIKPDTDADFEIPRWMDALNSLIPKSFNFELHRHGYQNWISFYSDSKCSGCGSCEEVCLSHKIELVDKKPVWKEEIKCYACFACINFCPRQAIQIQSRYPLYKSYTNVTGRYHHASVTFKDIAGQRFCLEKPID